MAKKLIIVYRFLDYDEAKELDHILNYEGIDSTIQQMPSDLTDPNYQISILEGDLQKASLIIKEFKTKLIVKIESNKEICQRSVLNHHLLFLRKNCLYLKESFLLELL